jgi:hypothetical protein
MHAIGGSKSRDILNKLGPLERHGFRGVATRISGETISEALSVQRSDGDLEAFNQIHFLDSPGKVYMPDQPADSNGIPMSFRIWHGEEICKHVGVAGSGVRQRRLTGPHENP